MKYPSTVFRRLVALLCCFSLLSLPLSLAEETSLPPATLEEPLTEAGGDPEELQVEADPEDPFQEMPEEDDVLLEGEEITLNALVLGSTGQEVRDLQTHLSELGYYTGEISGRYGESTADAVSRFQKDFSLPESGEADAQTLAQCYAAMYRPLTLGSEGADVKRLQTRLTQLGYYTGKITGTYLAATVEAVRAFQSKMALAASGDATLETQTLVYSSSARSRTGAAVSTPEPAADNEVINAENPDPDASPTVKYTKRLAYRSSGKLVKQLQQQLTDLGYYEGPISGSFQGNTRNAVKAFQEQNGLSVDGVVGEKTWNALFNDPEVARPEDTPRPQATPEPVPFHITVDVTNQAVTVYSRDENGEYTVVVRQMICSTGTKKNPSDVGEFVLNGRKTRWCYFPTWGDYAQYWTQINPSIAFHSVIYSRVDTMSLSIKSYRNLGSRASHGCVRLLVNDAKWIYDNVGKGTVVTITESLPKDPELKASLKAPELNRKNMLPVATPQPTAEPIYVSGAQPPQPLTKMQLNDSGENVWWLQQKLTELGYYHGKCSGTFLAGTQEAVRAFQKDAGLRVNGTADVQTLEKLYEKELA
ncbi:MAG: peptidoglycan-binding protein, partial [Clostridia bacterium]|nr:peptidoglycan-binding protein [Clostridia bacterium]